MRGGGIHPGCFPTGRHYPGIADRLAELMKNVAGLAPGLSAGMPWLEVSLVVIDFETTGTNSEQDRVIEIGAVGVDGGKVSFVEGILVNPGIPVPEESRAIHGISDEELEGAPSFAESFDHILGLLKGRVPCAYNASFDRGFLLAEFKRVGRVPSELPPALNESVSWIDPLVWAREILKEQKSRRLGDVAKTLGVNLEHAHRAAGDAEATANVLLRLAPRMPALYGELIRLQGRYAAFQDAQMAPWQRRG